MAKSDQIINIMQVFPLLVCVLFLLYCFLLCEYKAGFPYCSVILNFADSIFKITSGIVYKRAGIIDQTGILEGFRTIYGFTCFG